MRFLFLYTVFFLNIFAYPSYSTAVKEKRIYPMGKKIYTQRCSSIQTDTFETYDALYEYITKQCKELKPKYKEALSLYLWDMKENKTTEKELLQIKFSKEEKCPVCGMFLYKYPQWITEIDYATQHLHFDGVKDMMKYFFTHKAGISKIKVRDYYTQEVIDARKAYFVTGSDVYGPMGNELIPFKSKTSAQNFRLDHKGKKIVKFSEITNTLIDSLDGSY